MNTLIFVKHLAKTAAILMAMTASTYAFAGADLIATKIRLYRSAGPSSAQLDLFNRGYTTASAASVRVVFVDFGFADYARLYQYYGGTSGSSTLLKPNELGYLPFTIPTIVQVQPGNLVHVRLESADGSVNPMDQYVYACQKGAVGCE